jgi:hypothetical protein
MGIGSLGTCLRRTSTSCSGRLTYTPSPLRVVHSGRGRASSQSSPTEAMASCLACSVRSGSLRARYLFSIGNLPTLMPLGGLPYGEQPLPPVLETPSDNQGTSPCSWTTTEGL